MIDIEQLIFEYPGQRALDGISLHIEPGSVTALVGPNGAGKSTLLRCLAGLAQPLSGRITLGGIDVAAQPRQVHRQVGYLSDFYGLYERLRVQHCLQYAARAMGLDAAQAQARAATVAQQLNLQTLLERLPGQLSRGQRQRLAIAQAIVHQPAVLLLDEPASGLDPEARAELSQLLRQLQAQGMTLIVSSHILSELDEYCSHLLALRAGRIERHCALQPQHADTPALLPYALELAAPVDGAALRVLLAGCPVDDWHAAAQGQPLPLWLPAAAAARAQLLAQWVGAGLPVCGLQPRKARLQAHYHAHTAHNPQEAP